MDPLQEALAMLDKSAAIIQELLAQLQAKNGGGKNIEKQAEYIAAKTGRQYSEVADMLKEASEKGVDSDFVSKILEKTSKSFDSFGKVASIESSIQSSGSAAIDKYKEREAALMDSLG